MQVFGWSSTGSGLIFVAFIPSCFIGPLIGRQADKHGPWHLTIAAYSLAVVTHCAMCLIQRNATGKILLLCSLCVAMGFCEPLLFPANMAEVSRIVEGQEGGASREAILQSCALANLAIAGGAILGPLFAGYMKTWTGWTWMNISLAGLHLVSVIFTVVFMRHHDSFSSEIEPTENA